MTKISTRIPGKDAGGRKDLLNTLITFYEQETVDLGNYGRVTYSRLNHIAFSYQISIENPGKKEKKVIVRLWLGLSTDSEDIRSENYIYIIKKYIRLVHSKSEMRSEVLLTPALSR